MGGDGGELGDETKKNEGEHPVIGMGNALLGTRIGQCFEGGGESRKGNNGHE